MARELWLLRHGEAEESGPDDDRRLTPRGERQAETAGKALARLGLRFDAVLTSPKARARDTARLACAAVGGDPVDHDPLAGGFGAEDALELLSRQSDDARVLAVGHEPDFSETVRALSGGAVDMKKGGVAGLRVDDGQGELIALLRPDETEALSAS
jgi:phosphohistidine phosphatase